MPYLGNPTEYDYTLSLMSGFLHGLVCDETFDCEYHVINDVSNSTTEIASLHDMSIYPNPAGNTVFVKNVHTQAVVKLFSADGKLVSETTGATLDVSRLPEGIYMIESTGTSGTNVRGRLVVTH